MDQHRVSLGGMLSGRFPPYTPGHMYQTPTLYNGSPYWFSNGFLAAGSITFSKRSSGIETPIEVCYTLTDVQGKLQVVDENEVPQHQLQEGFSASPDNEERKLPPNEWAKRETNDTDEQSVPFEKDEDPAKYSPALQKQCSFFQHSSTEKTNSPMEVESNGQQLGGESPQECSYIAASFNQLYLREKSPQQVHEVLKSHRVVDSQLILHSNDHRRASDSVIQEPHHILSDAVEMLGEHLNALMTHVHRMPSNEVKFHVEAKVWEEKDQHHRPPLTRKEPVTEAKVWEEKDQHCRLKKEPVTDPSSYDRCPEAFDCRRILRHMRTSHNLCKYAEILDCRRSEDLKREINGLLGRIPGKRASRSPRPTWNSLFDTLGMMKNFIEQAVAGLTRNNEHELAAELDKGYDSLKVITDKAVRAQRMSLQM